MNLNPAITAVLPSSSELSSRLATLYVDLDGTLCATDTLWESLVELIRKQPLELLKSPLWLLRGKAAFKRAISDRVMPPVETLPLRPEVIELLQMRKKAGHRIVLATAADRRIAEMVAGRVGLFDDLLATDNSVNLAGANKLGAIRAHAAGEPFDYVGDSTADLCLLSVCDHAYFSGSRESVWRTMSRQRQSAGLAAPTRLSDGSSGFRSLLKALRPHQWAKNTLLGVPLLTSQSWSNSTALLHAGFGFISFSLVASAIYVINDILDLPSDRAHPNKRNRPFASGAVSIPTGFVLTTVLLGAGIFLSTATVGQKFTDTLLVYLVATTLYSTFLKKKIIIDVLMLAGLYAIRIFAGAVAIDVELSKWLIAFSIFIFLNLAMVKRYAELQALQQLDQNAPVGRRYTVVDMDLFRSCGTASAYASVMVFALYISSDEIMAHYSRPEFLWLVCPVMLYWLTRTWFLTNRARGRAVLEDPVVFALTDKASLLCGVITLLLLLLAH